MKNGLSGGRLSFFITPRIHGNVLAWLKPDSASQKSKQVVENILRWEEDGGKIMERDDATLDHKKEKSNG